MENTGNARVKRRARILVDGHLQCGKCGEWKPANDEHFVGEKSKKFGLSGTCRACHPKKARHKKVDAQTVTADGLKLCSRCRAHKPATSEFFGSGGRRRTFASRCLACERERRPAAKRGVAPDAGRLYPDGTKWCSRCREFKPATSEFFHNNKQNSTGYAYHCKACCAEKSRVVRQVPRVELPVTAVRRCSKCEQVFPATQEFFYASARTSAGLTPRCRSCCREDVSRRRAQKPEVVREGRRRYWEKRGEALNLSRRARRKGDEEYARADRERQRAYRGSRVFSVKIYGLRRRVLRDAPWCSTHLTYHELKAIYNAQDGRCAYCRRDLEYLKWEPDHIIPLSRRELGPTSEVGNIACACRKCNRNKSSKTLGEWSGRWYRLLPPARS